MLDSACNIFFKEPYTSLNNNQIGAGFILHLKLKKIFNRHFEWVALATGLLLMALMNPYVDQGASWCFFDWIGVGFCPGEGLGHSIAFSFRGDWSNALQANIMGPLAIVIMLSRIGTLLKQNYSHKLENTK